MDNKGYEKMMKILVRDNPFSVYKDIMELEKKLRILKEEKMDLEEKIFIANKILFEENLYAHPTRGLISYDEWAKEVLRTLYEKKAKKNNS